MPQTRSEVGTLNQIVGVWDLNKNLCSLGNLIIFAEELLVRAERLGGSGVGICFHGECSQVQLLSEDVVRDRSLIKLDQNIMNRSAILAVLSNIEGIYDLYYSSKRVSKGFSFQGKKCCVEWPPDDYRFGTTFYLQEFFRQNGRIHQLLLKKETLNFAQEFIKKFVFPHVPVIVHLKNNPKQKKDSSNASVDEWLRFFTACVAQYSEVKFVLIGNEEIDDRIGHLSNVILTKNLCGTLMLDLALIQIGFLFMGMSSGPSNIALFSKIPFLIYKNPNHHPEEMNLELGKQNHFPFSTPFQKFLRVYETHENLMSEFERLYSSLYYAYGSVKRRC